jgi:hypothetical protein
MPAMSQQTAAATNRRRRRADDGVVDGGAVDEGDLLARTPSTPPTARQENAERNAKISATAMASAGGTNAAAPA